MQSSISSQETINSAKSDLSKKTLDSIKDRKWILRLKELENRLKAEKEARIRDKKGAQERLADFLHENKELREELQMEKDVLHSKAPSELST